MKNLILALILIISVSCIQEKKQSIPEPKNNWSTLEKDGIKYRVSVFVMNDNMMKFHWDRGDKIRSKRLSTIGATKITFSKLTMVNHLKYRSKDGRVRDRWHMKTLMINGNQIMCVESHESPLGDDEPQTRIFELQPGDWLTFNPDMVNR